MSDLVTNQEVLDESQEFKAMLDESLTTLQNGAVVKGTIVRVTATEVIVDLGYKSDGIIVKSEYTDDSAAILTEIAKPGDVVEVFVVRVNDGEGNVLVSKRKVDSQANFKVLEQAFNDKTALSGKVIELVKGGLIANILGCRAFVPASQISARFEQNLEVFKGKEFNFNIIEFDRSKKRILAGRKELAVKEADEKRNEIFSKIEVGQSIEGVVSRLVDFGAFIDSRVRGFMEARAQAFGCTFRRARSNRGGYSGRRGEGQNFPFLARRRFKPVERHFGQISNWRNS